MLGFFIFFNIILSFYYLFICVYQLVMEVSMCGIFGYIGQRDALPIVLDGIKKLEYRGYDSSGIAGIKDHQLVIYKRKGKISMLEQALSGKDIRLSLALAHTRWATHGIPSESNAHPHLDTNHTVAVVHNGVIENYLLLKNELILSKGSLFSSETDTEVVPHLVAAYYQGDLLSAAREAFALLEGSFALALIHKDHPDQIIVTAEKSPLVIGFNPVSKETFVSSDPSALSEGGLDVYYLQDRQIALLQRGIPPQFMDRYGKIIEINSSKNGASTLQSSKGIYEHFMLKEIFEQPKTVESAMHNRYDMEKHIPYFEELDRSLIDLSKIEHIIIIACGTSFHAASVASYLLETLTHIDTRIEMGSEYRYKTPIVMPNTLVIALSQSGETADTIAAVRQMKSLALPVLALSNVFGSTLSREVDATIFLKAGPEVAVASTKTFTSQVTVLYLLTLLLARQRGMSGELADQYYLELEALPNKIEHILEEHRKIQAIAIKYGASHDMYFLGRGILYPVAQEAALKLKEIAYVNAVGYAAGEMKHGPIALLDPSVPVIVFCANRLLETKIMSNLMESRARSAPVIVFGLSELEEDFKKVCNEYFLIPKTSDELACILLAVATQLFSYYVAKTRFVDIDQPRNLAKSVTVE